MQTNTGMKLEYKVLAGTESLFMGGQTLGIKIMVAGTLLEGIDLDSSAIWQAADKAKEGLEQELTAASKAIDPEAQARAAGERRELLGCFDGPIFVEDLPNGYCSRGCCRHLPWFRVTTKVGHFVIGWRKRVINIDWSATVGTGKGDELFVGEDTTKGDKYVHAWSVEKAREYVTAIIKSAEIAVDAPGS